MVSAFSFRKPGRKTLPLKRRRGVSSSRSWTLTMKRVGLYFILLLLILLISGAYFVISNTSFPLSNSRNTEKFSLRHSNDIKFDLSQIDDEFKNIEPNESFLKISDRDFVYLSTSGDVPEDTISGDNIRIDTTELEINSMSFSISSWIFLATNDVSNNARSRTIVSNLFSSSSVDVSACDESQELLMTSNAVEERHGFRLFVNSPGTGDEALVFETIWRHNNTIKCRRLTSFGYQVPSSEWTHVAMSVDTAPSGTGVTLFINGENVASDADFNDFHWPKKFNDGEFFLGSNNDTGYSLHGFIAMFVVSQSEVMSNSDIRNYYLAGSNKQIISSLSSPDKIVYPIIRGFEHSSEDKLFEAFPSQSSLVEMKLSVDTSKLAMNTQPGENKNAANCFDKQDSFYARGENNANVNNIDLLENNNVGRIRREYIKDAMKHTWYSYKEYAWGKDELLPVTLGSVDHWGGIGATLIDSLDTLWLMDMKEEFYEGRDWITESLDFSRVQDGVSVFETTIRVLGGLLAAYDFSKEQIFLQKAEDLADRLDDAFDSPSGLPYMMTYLNKKKSYNPQWLGSNTILADAGSLLIEWRFLSKATGKKKYAQRVEKVMSILENRPHINGMLPISFSPISNRHSYNTLSFGGMGDSYYEYLLKGWLQSNKSESRLRRLYDDAIDGMHQYLLRRTKNRNLAYIGVVRSKREDKMPEPSNEMEHLTCFMGGLLALGAYTDPNGLQSSRAQRDLITAKSLTYTCYDMYKQMPTRLSPETIIFDNKAECDIRADQQKTFYTLRPEVLESLFILNKLTGDPIYREWGWEIFQSIETHCFTGHAFGRYRDVTTSKLQPEDKMESFFLAETIKYAYLLQDPDNNIDILKKHVFTTEAHLLRVFSDEM